jgi:hypothetical protein
VAKQRCRPVAQVEIEGNSTLQRDPTRESHRLAGSYPFCAIRRPPRSGTKAFGSVSVPVDLMSHR